MKKLLKIIQTVRALPRVDIRIDTHSEEGRRMFSYYTKRHPRFFLIRNKTLGVALLSLQAFPTYAEYLQSVSGKNSAAYYSRKAEKANYIFREIDPDTLADAIHAIHHSAETRQGKVLSSAYLEPLKMYPKNQHNFYYGLFKEDELVAYLWLVKSGELITFNRLMGHAAHLKNGIMFLLVLKGIERIFQLLPRPSYLMYDTLLGASEGLSLFKKRIGFKPFHVNWKS
ncbi:MAG: hypothetical protein JNL88_05915 [Bacteroidia bacterium]|nr:hypothetical protein [Bacteroidia bacterium]